MSRTLFIVRPEPGAATSLAKAKAMGLQTAAMPLFLVEPVAWDVPGPQHYEAILLTSANAVRHAGPGLKQLAGLPVHAVGEASAAAARAFGLHVETVGTGDVMALLALLHPTLRLLHLVGTHHEATDRAEVIAVYRSREVDLPPGFDRIIGQVVAVHSPRAARRLRELMDAQGIDVSTVALAAISERAMAAAGPGWQTVAVAERPEDGALLDQAARLCHTPAP